MKPTSLTPVLLALLAACSAPEGATRAEAARFSVDLRLPETGALLVSGDLVVPAGEHRRAAGEEGLLVLRGLRGVTLDLTGAHLLGAEPGAAPSDFSGRCLVVRDCADVRIVGGRLSGYRVGLWIENSTGVAVEGLVVDPAAGALLDGVGGPRPEGLEALVEREGAGVVVVDSADVDLRDLRVRGGAVGVAGLRLDRCRVEGADLAYLSARGVALQGSTRCELLGNRCDAITRGPGGGGAGLWLGPGCKGILVSGNVSRSGDAGGVDLGGRGNRWGWNDLSGNRRAALELAGGEAGWIVHNRVDGGAGLRLDETRSCVVLGNTLDGVRGAGLRIAGGGGVLVANNRLEDCDAGVELLEDSGATPTWLGGNGFRGNLQDLVLEEVTGVELWRNDFAPGAPFVHVDGLAGPGAEGAPEGRGAWALLADAEGDLPSGRAVRSRLGRARPEPPVEVGRAAGWSGPEGHRETPGGPALPGPVVLGLHGPWDPEGGSPRPAPPAARGPLAGVRWRASWFTWDEASDPRGDLDRWRARRFDDPVRALVEGWADPWAGDLALRERLPSDRFGLMAQAELQLPAAGTYVLRVRSDDGVRVRIDGEVVLEDWSWHPARLESRALDLDAGPHLLELEYFQVDGAAVLQLGLEERGAFPEAGSVEIP